MIDPFGIKIQPEETKAALPESENITPSLKLTTQPEPLDLNGFPHIKQRKDGSAKPKATIENVEHLLKGYGIRVSYNGISKEMIIQIPGLTVMTDNYHNSVIESINSLAALNDIAITQVPKYIGVIADRNPVNPVATWITSRPWDGKDRLPDFCKTLTTQDDYPGDFKDLLLKKWLISAVAAVMLPSGFHSRGILTLQGPQGCGKTSWVRSLIPDDILRETVILTGHHLDPSNKDSLTTAIKHWIVEIGELDSSFKKDIARLKGFVTQGTDKVRRPYARTDSEYQRRTVFCATVNEIAFLIDKTGNSRFWVIPVVSIDYDHKIDMQQLFSQIKFNLDADTSWWLTPDEDIRLDELNRDHRAVSVLEEKLLEAFDFDLPPDRWPNMSATEVLEFIGYNRPPNPLCRECGGILREHCGQPKKNQGIMKWKVPLPAGTYRV